MNVQIEHSINDLVFFINDGKIIEGMIKHITVNVISNEDANYPYTDMREPHMGVTINYYAIDNNKNPNMSFKNKSIYRISKIFLTRESIEEHVKELELKKYY